MEGFGRSKIDRSLGIKVNGAGFEIGFVNAASGTIDRDDPTLF
jgi:hypothetical protein